MSESPTPPPSPLPPTSEPSVHLLTLRNPSSVADPRAWGLNSNERRLHMGRVITDRLTSGDGNEFGDRHAVKMTNRLRSAASVVDQRAWSRDPAQRRQFMLDTIRRSPVASTTDLQHQEVMAQLRENNLPEFVERLLSDKNQQIEDLEQNVRSLAQQSMRSVSAGDKSSGQLAALSGLSDEHHPSPEVLRRAATSTHSDTAGDLSRPDISMVYQKEVAQEPSSPSAVRPASPALSPRPGSPGAGSEHSWDSAPTVAGGASQHGGSTGSELASAAGSSASGDSIHNLKAALARKKQLLNARKQQLERSARGERLEQQQQQGADTQSIDSPAQPSAADLAEVTRIQQHLVQLRSRLDVLDPILARLDADYSNMADGMAEQKVSASETELHLMTEVAEMRQTVERQDADRCRLEQDIQLMVEQGVSESEPRRSQLEQQLLITLRDMEINKLDACSKMHEASALMSRAQRHAHQEETERQGPDSELASSGYMSEMPETAASPSDRGDLSSHSPPQSPSYSYPHSPQYSPQKSPQHSPQHSPQYSPQNSPQYSPQHSPQKSPQKSPQHSPQYSPQHSSQYSPQYSPQHSPQHSPQKSPQHSPQQSPQYSPQHSPQNSPQHSPGTSLQHSPQYSPQHIPQKSPQHSPQKSPQKSPHQSPQKSPQQSSQYSPQQSPQHSHPHSPQLSPRLSERQPVYQPSYQPDYQPKPEEEASDTEGESAFESGVTDFESDTEQVGSTCDAGVDWQSSCPSLTDEMTGLADINAEVDRLRARISELERELGQRGDAPSSEPGPWRCRLEQERVAWSQERQRLQQRIVHLDGEQERLRTLGGGRAAPAAGDGDDTQLQYAYGRFLRAESYRRALCWQKRYLMVLLGGYQETEVLTLQRMTQLTGGTFRPDGRRYLPPAAKFRAVVWVAVAVSRMDFMVNRWRSGRRVAGALTSGPEPLTSVPEPLTSGPEPPASTAVRVLSSASLVSASTCDAHAELDRLGRIVRNCPGSLPDVQFDARSVTSVTSVSDVCTEDLEPYLARFDALLDRQGLPPQSGRRPDSSR